MHRSSLDLRPLREFAVVCLLLTWIPWLLLGLLGADVDNGIGSLVFGLAAGGPSLAALVMWLRHRGERRPGPGVRWSPGWPVVAVLLGGVAPVGAAVPPSGAGGLWLKVVLLAAAAAAVAAVWRRAPAGSPPAPVAAGRPRHGTAHARQH